MNFNNYKAKQIPATTITGSIKGYWANADTTISDCVMGEFHQDHLTNTSTIATDPGVTIVTEVGIGVSRGQYLEGPFIALTTNASGIVYYDGAPLIQTDA